MSTGGIFKLINNTGLQDKLLMANEYLKKRIDVLQARNKQNDARSGGLDLDKSFLPDINIIEKSHNIFINGAFKPFVASGFEYNKSNSSGQSFGSTIKFVLPQYGDFINDSVIHVKIGKLATLDEHDRVRYVALLGHKLFSKIEFFVNHNKLDSYTSDDYNAFLQFKVPPSKKTGWLRNMGQEIPETAEVTADPSYDMIKEYRYFGDGNQTFKQSHDEVHLWIPLLFWFREVHNSLPSMIIPYGQTEVRADLVKFNQIVSSSNLSGNDGLLYTEPTIDLELYTNNIFVNPEISSIFMDKFGFSLIRVHKQHVKTITRENEELLNDLVWPTETLYVCFKPRKNLTLSQHWHKSSSLTLNSVKVPVVVRSASLIIGGNVGNNPASTTSTASLTRTSGPALSTIDNTYKDYDFVITGGTGYDKDNILNNRYIVSDYVGATNLITINGTWNGATPNATTTFQLFTPQIGINTAQYYKETPVIKEIEIKAHSIVIYRNTHETFYNSYLPYRFGDKMNTPDERGWYQLNFNFNPGDHDPSGHINLSTAREFYINFTARTSTSISSTNPVDMIVLADAINFLLVKDGTAVLRYSN